MYMLVALIFLCLKPPDIRKKPTKLCLRRHRDLGQKFRLFSVLLPSLHICCYSAGPAEVMQLHRRMLILHSDPTSHRHDSGLDSQWGRIRGHTHQRHWCWSQNYCLTSHYDWKLPHFLESSIPLTAAVPFSVLQCSIPYQHPIKCGDSCSYIEQFK